MKQIINNYELIKDLLVFDELGDVYYTINIIQRRKDNPELHKSEVLRDQFFISSLGKIEEKMEKIMEITDRYNARAYISMCPRSKTKALNETLSEIVNKITREIYVADPWNISSKMATSRDTIVSKKILGHSIFLLDVDTTREDIQNVVISETKNILRIIPTFNGIHILVKAGDQNLFKTEPKHFDIQKDCNTILYAVKDGKC